MALDSIHDYSKLMVLKKKVNGVESGSNSPVRKKHRFAVVESSFL